MHRCFAEADSWRDGQVSLSQEESVHLSRVLRARAGDPATVFDGQGRVSPAEVIDASPRASRLRLTGPATQHPRPTPSITLVQAIPKGAHMDQIVEKATELGVAGIAPVLTERTVRRPAGDPNERWTRIAVNAAKQCGTPWVPSVRRPEPLASTLSSLAQNVDLLLVGSLEKDSGNLSSALRAGGKHDRIGLIIGPEGDLTAGEYKAARDAGAVPVSFGALVLRVETAAIYGLSVLRYEFGG